MHGEARLISYGVTALVIVVVFALRMRRMTRSQPLKLERLWIVPAVFAVLAGLLLVQAPPQGMDWAWLAIALAIGGGLGWVRGSTMAIAVDPETHALNTKASPAAMIFLVALIAFRYVARSALANEATVLHLTAAFITDVTLSFAVGLLSVQRLEMAIRARRLLAAAKAAAAGG
jgi:hypothetical protein